MKGIIFNLFESFVTDNFGQEKYKKIESKTKFKTQEPFVGPGTYPNKNLFALIATAVEILNIPGPDAVKAFGKYMFPKLIDKYPIFVENLRASVIRLDHT